MNLCSIEGCQRKHYAKGYCAKHYKQKFRKFIGSNCTIEGCTNKADSHGLCGKHLARYNQGKDPNTRTRLDKNHILIDGDIARIILCDNHGVPSAEAIIDAEDIAKVANYKWGKTSHGYVRSQNQYLHHAIIGKRDGRHVDHINRDKMDNRKANLRIVERRINVVNTPQHSNNKSGYKGVVKTKAGRWAAFAGPKNAGRRNLGTFDTPEAAAMAYNKFMSEYYGGMAWLNPVPSS